MQIIFHGLLGVAVGIVATGIVCGVAARAHRPVTVAQASTAASRHEERMHPALEDALAPPEPLLPRYAERVAAGSIIAWALDPRTDGARLELSTTPQFDAATIRHVDVAGDRFRLPASLPSGVWYWRLRGRAGSVVGERATPPRMVFVAPAQGEGNWG